MYVPRRAVCTRVCRAPTRPRCRRWSISALGRWRTTVRPAASRPRTTCGPRTAAATVTRRTRPCFSSARRFSVVSAAAPRSGRWYGQRRRSLSAAERRGRPGGGERRRHVRGRPLWLLPRSRWRGAETLIEGGVGGWYGDRVRGGTADHSNDRNITTGRLLSVSWGRRYAGALLHRARYTIKYNNGDNDTTFCYYPLAPPRR